MAYSPKIERLHPRQPPTVIETVEQARRFVADETRSAAGWRRLVADWLAIAAHRDLRGDRDGVAVAREISDVFASAAARAL